MKTLIVAVLLAALAVGCDKKASESASPSASASAAASAPAAPVASEAPVVSAAPALAAAAPSNVPTEEQYEQKAQTAIATPSAAEVELTKIEKEIGQ